MSPQQQYDSNPVGKPVPPSLLRDLCEQLGYDPRDVAEILVQPLEIQVLTYQRDSKGRVVTNHVPLNALQKLGVSRGHDVNRDKVPATVLHVHKVEG